MRKPANDEPLLMVKEAPAAPPAPEEKKNEPAPSPAPGPGDIGPLPKLAKSLALQATSDANEKIYAISSAIADVPVDEAAPVPEALAKMFMDVADFATDIAVKLSPDLSKKVEAEKAELAKAAAEREEAAKYEAASAKWDEGMARVVALEKAITERDAELHKSIEIASQLKDALNRVSVQLGNLLMSKSARPALPTSNSATSEPAAPAPAGTEDVRETTETAASKPHVWSRPLGAQRS